MKLKVKVDVDLGNTESRVGIIQGDKKIRFNQSNSFVFLKEGYNVNEKYAKPTSSIFKVKDEDGNDVYVANGLIVEREFKRVAIRPSGLKKKTQQETTVLSLQLIIAKVYHLIAKINNIPVETLDLDIELTVLLPPTEHTTSSNDMKKLVQSIKEVSVVSPYVIEKELTFADVRVASEAVTGFISAFYKEVGLERDGLNSKSLYDWECIVYRYTEATKLLEVAENEKFKTGYVMVLDIGGGTTDVAVFKDLELLEVSKETFKLGGNNIEAEVKRKIKSNFGYVPDNIQQVVQTCELENGTEVFDVSGVVTLAKEMYSDNMTNELLSYLETLNISIQQVKGVLTLGGGSTSSKVDGEVVSPPVSEVLVDYLREDAPNISPVETGDRDLRSFNIEGSLLTTRYQ